MHIEVAALADLEAAEFEFPRCAVARRLADIEREALMWLWEGRIPLGKVSMLVGDPGLGKSMVTLGMAATVSRGGRWPIRGEGVAPAGDVVLVSAEDDPADTIRPRLEAAGADLNRVHILDGIKEVTDAGERIKRPWNLADLPELERLFERLPACKLLVIDPVSAYLAGADSHKNADIRALLAPLSELAAKHKLAALAVSHLNKSQGPAIYRTTGSLAFAAAARAVYCVTKDADDPGRRILVPIKANLAPDASGVAYRIGTDETGTPRLEWEPDAFPVDPNEALSREPDEDRSATTECAEWLRGELANGPKLAKELQREAREAGFTDKVLRRARERLNIKPRKRDFSKGWAWELPAKMP
ncbi:MAG: AAA family ATPase, partial [Gammaproteobacteria bacterium]